MYAIAQEDFLRAQIGDRKLPGVQTPLVCGSPYEKELRQPAGQARP